LPYGLSGELDTIGPRDFGGTLPGGFAGRITTLASAVLLTVSLVYDVMLIAIAQSAALGGPAGHHGAGRRGGPGPGGGSGRSPRDHPGWVRCPGPPDMTISAMGNPGLRQAFINVPDELGTTRTHVTAPIGR